MEAKIARRRTPMANRDPLRIAPIAFALLALSACATLPSDPEARAEFQKVNDPAEPTNRAIFAANRYVDANALKPVAQGYKDYVPGGARRSIHNFVNNMAEPGIAVNDLLQGNLARAWNTTERFAVNTTVGGVGLFDVASDLDLPRHQADFGQTLGVWGVGPGPKVQLPLLGPSDLRDAAGQVVGLATNPLNAVTGGAGIVLTVGSGLGVVDGRAGLLSATDSLERSSLDYYATLRSLQEQRRAKLVEEGKAGLVDQSSAGKTTR